MLKAEGILTAIIALSVVSVAAVVIIYTIRVEGLKVEGGCPLVYQTGASNESICQTNH